MTSTLAINISHIQPIDSTIWPSTTEITDTTTTPITGIDLCKFNTVQYKFFPATVCALCAIFGLMYGFFGSKFFKAVMFLTGLILGGSLTWLICQNASSQILDLKISIGISAAAGILTGIITMLLEMVGLFVTGFVFGGLLAISTLVGVLYLAAEPLSRWSSLGLIAGIGLILALATIHWRRILVILGTAVIGGFLLTIALDYYVEEFRATSIILAALHQLPNNSKPKLCWISWVLLLFWPLVILFGFIIQLKVTSKPKKRHTVVRGHKHKRIILKSSAKVYSPPKNIQSSQLKPMIPLQERQQASTSNSNSGVDSGNNFRRIYQKRTCHGDVISRMGIENIRHELSPAMRSVLERSQSMA